MAGSWNHTVDRETGKLLSNVDLVGMLENGGDVYEYAEEVYGMVWWLADRLSLQLPGKTAAGWIEEARQNYRQGLALSPGVAEEDL